MKIRALHNLQVTTKRKNNIVPSGQCADCGLLRKECHCPLGFREFVQK